MTAKFRRLLQLLHNRFLKGLQVLGDKIDQKGSLVNEDRLRFDFSYNKPIEVEELKKVEEIVPNRTFRRYANSESPT